MKKILLFFAGFFLLGILLFCLSLVSAEDELNQKIVFEYYEGMNDIFKFKWNSINNYLEVNSDVRSGPWRYALPYTHYPTVDSIFINLVGLYAYEREDIVKMLGATSFKEAIELANLIAKERGIEKLFVSMEDLDSSDIRDTLSIGFDFEEDNPEDLENRYNEDTFFEFDKTELNQKIVFEYYEGMNDIFKFKWNSINNHLEVNGNVNTWYQSASSKRRETEKSYDFDYTSNPLGDSNFANLVGIYPEEQDDVLTMLQANSFKEAIELSNIIQVQRGQEKLSIGIVETEDNPNEFTFDEEVSTTTNDQFAFNEKIDETESNQFDFGVA
ncbi:MAG: hypothetical protein WC438_02155 [Candidatus Pacearchaeota archaeon]